MADSETTLAVENPATINVGDGVTIVRRDQTPADIKSQLYYPHLGGLAGTVLKIYGEEVSVQLTRATLPEAIRMRHDEIEKGMRQKWLDGLSDEARNKLGEKEKQFNLAYTVLVALKDVEKRAPAMEGDTPPEAPPIVAATQAERRAVREAAREAGGAMQAIDPMTGQSDFAMPDTINSGS